MAESTTKGARTEGPQRGTMLVWDLPVRLFHWLTAILVAAAYVTWRLNWMDWHVIAGEAVLALVLFRLVWGLIGSDTARFAGFIAGPRIVWHHLAELRRREPDRQIGHNPAGGVMVLLFLLLLLGQTLTGIIDNNDIASAGPLTDHMSAALANLIDDLHTWLWNALLVAIALHVAAIAGYALVKRHDLVRPMLTGRKRIDDAVPPRIRSNLLALIVSVLSVAVAVALTATL